MPVNKVIYGVTTLIDITDSTVTPDKLATGVTAYDKSGTKITGTLDSSSVKLYRSSAIPSNSVGNNNDICFVQTDSLNEMILSDFTSMAVGDSKKVLIINPHVNNGYALGYDGSNVVSTGYGFSDESAIESTANEVKNNSNYIWTLTKDSSSTYSIKVNGYNPYGTSNASVSWSTTTMEYRLSDAATIALGSTTDMMDGYDTRKCIRFIRNNSTSNSYLNSSGSANYLRYAAGTGEWSIWYVFDISSSGTGLIYKKTNDYWEESSIEGISEAL